MNLKVSEGSRWGIKSVFTGEEDEDVSGRLRDVDLQHGDHAGFEVVSLRSLGVHDVDRVAPPGDVEDGRVVKVLGELGGVERGRGDEQLEVGAEARDILEQAEEDVGVQRALVRLVEHHRRVAREVRLAQELTEQHAVCHVPAERGRKRRRVGSAVAVRGSRGSGQSRRRWGQRT